MLRILLLLAVIAATLCVCGCGLDEHAKLADDAAKAAAAAKAEAAEILARYAEQSETFVAFIAGHYRMRNWYRAAIQERDAEIERLAQIIREANRDR